ncbi:class I SAM-dependent methyltransferase [Corynebacterium variabile]|uniref:class I SAM-dependent methyltransferase n=1 Tax=Corynebacterium variabile TaxID=1727 RepID=UPI00264A3E9E|nr:methyltransferase domain-containing protein [Corynebacterium variabile]MDN6476572.1 methyltransferase domain-containing protein [Corynebacterium variabile]MDN6620092.1 methyltransferase domain-containing protein [Corynebacterium variabile]MDN6675781.1 methyltransferase domain-containing protein [Corynebacterium variabile]MDN6814124.1 methyltransferase domain-containing protein [Corynebacterium variabile]
MKSPVENAAPESAEKYTHGHGDAVLGNHARRTATDSLAFSLPYLTAGSRVLDVGCGPGSITLDLAAMIAGLGGAASQVTGVENTPVPLEAACAAAEARGIGAQFLPGDVYRLPFEDASFDVVVAHQVFQHLTDPVVALQECLRVTAPGGVVALRDADYAAMSYHPAPLGLREWTHRYRAMAQANGAEPDAGRHLVGWALSAGCPIEDLTYSTSTWVWSNAPGGRPTADLADSWRARVNEERFRDQLAGVLGTWDADAVEAAAGRICHGWREWADDPAAIFLMLHGELLIRR